VATRPQAVLPPEDLYKAALSDYTKGEYDLAITGFRSYLKNYPRTSLTPNAQYWLAECYFSQKNYGQAVDEFDVVVREYPDSPKVPSALFKQGEAYLQAGDTKNATTVLCELMSKHGKTREARLARDKNLRCR
jgi:tol-pal system protein YbgF